MKKVEKAEEYIRKLGVYNVRVRIHEDIARIEIDHKDIEEFIGNRENIVSYFKGLGYQYVTLDLEGFRSGSMDYKIEDK